MTIHLMPVKAELNPHVVQQGLIASCADVRHAIAEATTVKEAYALYDSLRALEVEIQHLVNLAADQCNAILEKL